MFFSLVWLVIFCCIQHGDNFAIRGCDVHTYLQSTMLKVLCYERGLHYVPEQLPPNTLLLDISFNNVEVIRSADLRNITHLENLNASDNRIRVIERESFQWLTALKILNLNNNKLTILHNNMFEGLQNVSILSLNNNSITSIQSLALVPLENLKVLSLSFNPLQTLGSVRSVLQLPNLKEIHFENISLGKFVSSDFENMSLLTIDISSNPLNLISFNTDALQGLASLDISFSKPLTWMIEDPCFLKGLERVRLEGIGLSPSNISEIIQSLNCSTLVEINLGQLNLKDTDHIIQDICLQHPRMQTLYLHGNKYTNLEIGTFQNCTALKVLDLSNNQFVHVSAPAFQHLASLEQLTLASNKLVALPEDLSDMGHLKQINLSYNHLREAYLTDTKSFQNLKHLDLSGNKISVFHASSSENWSLEYLNLGENLLFDIPMSFGANLKKLQSLILRKNKLSSLTYGTFQNLTSLMYLNLIDNQIEDIEPGAFKNLHNLRHLLLGSNKLTAKVFQNDTFQGLESLFELQLFSNYIEYDTPKKLAVPPFHALKSLNILSLNSQGHNGMRNLPANILEGLKSLYKIYLGNLALNTIDNSVFSYIPQLSELDLSNNVIPTLDPNLLKPVQHLTELHLNRMTLESLEFFVELNLSKLFLLRVAYNQLNSFNESQHKALPSLKFLDMRRNPMLCSCDNLWFINWVKKDPKTQVLSFYEYQCAYPPSNKGQKLYTFNTDNCRLYYDYYLFVSTSLTISLWLLSSTMWKLWRWYALYCYYIILGYFHNRRFRRKMQRYEYDAFISYNCHDEDWVFNQLIPNLEETHHWKLCLHHRDFEPGKPIVDNITDSIYSSRKTICVISRHYLDSEWCSKEMQVASYRLFDEHTDVLILLFLEKIPHYRLSPYHRIRRVLKKKTYLLYPKDINATVVFWNNVNQALEDDKGFVEVENVR